MDTPLLQQEDQVNPAGKAGVMRESPTSWPLSSAHRGFTHSQPVRQRIIELLQVRPDAAQPGGVDAQLVGGILPQVRNAYPTAAAANPPYPSPWKYCLSR
jgi:hypothetical protein